jgi:hypothetical protein
VDRDPAQWRPRLTELHEEYFRDTDPLAPVRLEIIDRATDEALQRLVEAGLITRTIRATRPLFPQDDPAAMPSPLTDAERAQATAHRAHGARKLKMAYARWHRFRPDEARPRCSTPRKASRAPSRGGDRSRNRLLDDALPPLSPVERGLPVLRFFVAEATSNLNPSPVWGTS